MESLNLGLGAGLELMTYRLYTLIKQQLQSACLVLS